MSNIGVIGDADSVLGFKTFGLDAYACENKEEAVETLRHLVKKEYGIVYITEKFYMQMEKDIAKYEDLRVPAIIPIPGIDGSYGIGIKKVKKSVEKAVGADILFGEE